MLTSTTATVVNPTTLILDTPLPSHAGKVRVDINEIVDSLTTRASLQDWLVALRQR